MPAVISALAAALTLMQSAPVNHACSALTPEQISSLIGRARTLPVTATASGSTCMFRNDDRTITVIMATPSTPEAAQALFNAKKRIAKGIDIPGWGVPAYRGGLSTTAVVGVLMEETLTEVKLIDRWQVVEDVTGKLRAVMKEIATKK
jgi:hypothetical protein